MRLNSNQLEAVAVASICGTDSTATALLLGQLNEDHFYLEACKDAFIRITQLFKVEGKAPAFVALSNDPALPEASRKFLKNIMEDPVVGADACKDIILRLNDYRKLRALVSIVKRVDEAVNEEECDVDALIAQVNEQSSNLQVLGETESDIVRFGYGGDSRDLVLEVIRGEDTYYIPTGFNAFDSVNYGLPLKALVTIGGTSGGGKSALAMQLLKNTVGLGYSGCLVTLEMSKQEMTARLLANCSGKVNPAKILAGKTTKGEKQQIADAYKEWIAQMEAKESYFDLMAPSKAVTIQEVLLTLKPRGFKIVIIDYMSLLDGATGEDQWRKLGDIAWFAKMWANANNAVVILLAQVNDEGRLKYSQTVKEHSSCCWLFTSDEKAREAQIIEIEQVKARNQRMFNFMLRTDLEFMRIFDDTTPSANNQDF